MDLPDWAKDAVYVETHCVFSWQDRFRIFLKGKLDVRSRTLCEVPPGRLETDRVTLTAERLFRNPFRKRMELGYVEVEKEEALQTRSVSS